MAAEVGENAIDIALKVARALSAVGADYDIRRAGSLPLATFQGRVVQQIPDAISDMVIVKGPHSKLEWAIRPFSPRTA